MASSAQQQPSATAKITREADALALLQKSLDALGGSQAAQAVRDCVTTGSVVDSAGAKRSFTWKDVMTADAIASSVEVTSDKGTSGFATSKTAAISLDPANPVKIPPYAYLSNPPYHLPAVLLYRIITDPRYSVRSCGSNCVKTALEDDAVSRVLTQQRWLISELSSLPVELHYKVADLRFPEYSNFESITFEDFRGHDGLLVPHHMTSRQENGDDPRSITVESVAFNQSVQVDPATEVPE